MTNYYVTVSGAGLKDGSDWDNAFGLDEFIYDIGWNCVAGDNYWIQGGTYTYTAAMNTGIDGSLALPISIIGVKSTTTAEPPTISDYANGNDRPLFSMGSNRFILDDYYTIRNIRFTGTASTDLVHLDVWAQVINCYINNSSGTTGYNALSVDDASRVFNCELISANGSALDAYGAHGIDVVYSYLSGDIGIEATPANSLRSLFNIFDSCATAGISLSTSPWPFIFNNTFYGCGSGILGTTTYGGTILNNTISDCTNGINFTSTSVQALIDYNNYYNNTTDVTGITKGSNALAVDPKFTNAAGGDFSLASDSALIGAGLGITLGVG